jgi:hypothetical protein
MKIFKIFIHIGFVHLVGKEMIVIKRTAYFVCKKRQQKYLYVVTLLARMAAIMDMLCTLLPSKAV